MARTGHRRVTFRASVGQREGKRLLGRPWSRREDKLIFKKSDGQALTGLIWLWIVTGGGCL